MLSRRISRLNIRMHLRGRSAAVVPTTLRVFWTKLPAALRASIVARLPGSRIVQLLDLDEDESRQWIVDAPHDHAVTLLSRIPRERRLSIVNSLADRERRLRLLRHLQFPAHSVGSMVGDVLYRINVDEQAADVLDNLRAGGAEEPWRIVAVDSNGQYAGGVDLWRLVASDKLVGTIRDYMLDVPSILPETPIADAVSREDWLRHNWLPVVDHRRHVLGGVSRAKLFGAAGQNTMGRSKIDPVFSDLMSDLVYVFAALLDGVLSRGKAS